MLWYCFFLFEIGKFVEMKSTVVELNVLFEMNKHFVVQWKSNILQFHIRKTVSENMPVQMCQNMREFVLMFNKIN